MKDAYYFQHDYNARNDQKILILRDKFGLEGYALYWMCLEAMAEEQDGYVYRGAIGGLSVSFNTPKETLQTLIDFCIEIELFIKDKKGICSLRMNEHKNLRKTLSLAGKKGAKIMWENREAMATPMQRKGKERKGKEININKIPVKNNDIITLKDGTKAKLYFGSWVDVNDTKIAINRAGYPELSKYEIIQ